MLAHELLAGQTAQDHRIKGRPGAVLEFERLVDEFGACRIIVVDHVQIDVFEHCPGLLGRRGKSPAQTLFEQDLVGRIAVAEKDAQYPGARRRVDCRGRIGPCCAMGQQEQAGQQQGAVLTHPDPRVMCHWHGQWMGHDSGYGSRLPMMRDRRAVSRRLNRWRFAPSKAIVAIRICQTMGRGSGLNE